MKQVLIAGARPNFVKVAPLMRALQEAGEEPFLVHTGQHYDWAMSESLFRDLGIPEPDANLGVGSGSHAVQTARVMTAFEDWLDANPVDQVVVLGDVNSTVACTLVAAKRGVPVAHVEAGLRSFDRGMPEEINRIVVDALAAWLFTPSTEGDANLLAEGVDPSRIHMVGNIMVDSLLANLPRALQTDVRSRLEVPVRYGLITLHRPALVDDADRLRGVLGALADIADELPLLFPVHPRTRKRIADAGLGEAAGSMRFVDPLGYLDFLNLQEGAALVLTDSGGIQEETTVLGVPCLTLRENTERPITITHGTNRLVGLDPEAIRTEAARALADRQVPVRPDLWDGRTSHRIAGLLRAGDTDVEWVPAAARRSTALQHRVEYAV